MVEEFKKATTQNLFSNDKVTKEELVTALYTAYYDARKRKRGSMDEIKIEFELAPNIENLADTILNFSYAPSRSIAFMISVPVTREIFAAPFRDRIVHHFLYLMCGDWWDRRFITDAYSCRPEKGTDYGRKRIQKKMRKVSKMGKVPTTAQKCDLSGYFMSLSRARLYERVCWGLNQQFARAPKLKRMMKFLWKQVIFDNPVDGVTIRGRSKDWKKLPRNKSLFCQPEGKGIVIGNLTSQLLSNIYLDMLDRYIVFTLGYKDYGRYVDDFIIFTETKDRPKLLKDMKKIQKFLKSLGLELHPHKTYGQPIEHGVEFLGVVIYLWHMQPGKRLKRNFSRAVHKAKDFPTPRNLEVIQSYEGMFKHLQGDKWKKRMYERVGFRSRF